MTMSAAVVKVKENAFVLTETGDKNYSNGQRRLFELLPKDGSKISSTDLTHLRQKKWKNWDPDHPYTTVNVTMHHLMEKIDLNNEPFILLQTEPKGPYPIEYWLEPLPPSRRSQKSREERRVNVSRG